MDTYELRSKVWALMKQLEAQERQHTPAEWYRGGMNACMTILGWLPEPPKPCPFCGCTTAEEIDGLTNGWYAMCVQCQAKGPFAETQADALATWNTRKEPA